MSYTYSTTCVRDRMSRARTPFGSVPISTIYGFDYPLLTDTATDSLFKHENISDCVDYMVRRSRAFSENRLSDSYYTSPSVAPLSFMPSALRTAREMTPLKTVTTSYRSDRYTREPTPFRATSPIREPFETRPWIHHKPRSTTLTFSSSTPWNATGYYYYPRYPESYRGTASTYSPTGRRYGDDYYSDYYYRPYPYQYFRFPVRRYIPGVSSTYSRRF